MKGTFFRSSFVHLGKRKLKSSMVGVVVFPALILEKKFSTKRVRRLQTFRWLTYSGFNKYKFSLRHLSPFEQRIPLYAEHALLVH